MLAFPFLWNVEKSYFRMFTVCSSLNAAERWRWEIGKIDRRERGIFGKHWHTTFFSPNVDHDIFLICNESFIFVQDSHDTQVLDVQLR